MRNSNEITVGEAYAAEMIYFRSIAAYYGSNLKIAIDKHRGLYRQYCLKKVDGKKIVFINYINRKWLYGEPVRDDEPYSILSEPDSYGKQIDQTFVYVNLSENRECTIDESNRYAAVFWSGLPDWKSE